MRIGIHNEPLDGGVGGAEISVARLAESLASSHVVEIIHHKRSVTREQLAEYSGTDLSKVSVRYVEPEPYSFGTSHLPWTRYSDARRWRKSLSAPYDVFISFVHGVPAFCHASRGVLAVLFPLDEPAGLRADARSSSLSGLVKRAYHRWEWKQRLAGYQQWIAISKFTRNWARRRWGIECDVIYPPVDATFDVKEKGNIIVSVGRFATLGHSKKQLEMLGAFEELARELPTWEYFSVGGVEDSAPAREYFAKANAIAQRTSGIAHVEGNIDRGRLTQLYQRSKIFWHAAGLGDDEDRYPERSEHFGMVTVEAMAAGCVPIVINKGAQGEIVQHGVSGFLWNSVEELKRYTTQVAQDELLRVQMGTAARLRAERFSTQEFVRQFARLIE